MIFPLTQKRFKTSCLQGVGIGVEFQLSRLCRYLIFLQIRFQFYCLEFQCSIGYLRRGLKFYDSYVGNCIPIPQASLPPTSEYDVCRCSIVARPCCTSIYGDCIIETQVQSRSYEYEEIHLNFQDISVMIAEAFELKNSPTFNLPIFIFYASFRLFSSFQHHSSLCLECRIVHFGAIDTLNWVASFYFHCKLSTIISKLASNICFVTFFFFLFLFFPSYFLVRHLFLCVCFFLFDMLNIRHVIFVQEYCSFYKGYYHNESQSCSQVCMHLSS